VTIELTDPTSAGPTRDSALNRAALAMIKDPRDLPFVWLTLSASLVLIPFAVFLYLPGQFRVWLAAIYLVVLLAVFFDRYILMLHNTSHRRLFTGRWTFLNHYIPAVLGPLMGQTPYTYYAHHIGMHHPENNLPDDLSSTMKYRRDSFRGFMRYFLEFFFLGIFQLTRYHWTRRRTRLFRMALVGELSWYAIIVGLCVVNWQATLAVFIIPFLLCRFLMMAGNWVQHAFIDPRDPSNPYLNSITCINSRYNRRCFNDGYHIGHHIKSNRHWTEMPVEFRDNLARYRDEDAVIFEGTDYFIIWLNLMTKRYTWLADRFVDLREDKRTRDEIIALLKARVEPIPG